MGPIPYRNTYKILRLRYLKIQRHTECLEITSLTSKINEKEDQMTKKEDRRGETRTEVGDF